MPDEEDKKEVELLEKAKPKSDFYKLFGLAASRPEPTEVDDRWEGPDCILDVTLHGQKFRAVGSYERPLSGLMSLAMVGAGVQKASGGAAVRYLVEYWGTLRGRAIEAYMSQIREGVESRASTLLGSSTEKTKALMVLTDDGSEFKVMENPSGSSVRFYSLKRQATDT